jgi:flagellar motor switch/type III secretory pathway protein FliN
MPLATEDKIRSNGSPGGGAPTGAAPVTADTNGDISAPAGPAVAATGDTGLAVRETVANDALPDVQDQDIRLERLPMQVDVLVKVRSFRVQDLLSMQKGTVVETFQEHTQDVPVRCGGALLLWSEFEVLDQRLAVRVTRLA